MMKQRVLRWARQVSNDERGSAFLIVGTFLILLLFVGMATDFGIVLRYRRAMQNACDSGVLAGAQDLLKGSGATTAQSTATTFASNDMTQNNVQWDNFQTQPESANGTANLINPVRLAASIHATVPLFFMALVRPSLGVAVQCAAEVVPAGAAGLWPLGMNWTQWLQFFQHINQGNANCTYPAAGCVPGCPLIGDTTTPAPAACSTPGTIPGCTACSPGDTQLSFAVARTQWGSGNSGTLQMTNTNCSGGGASALACTFALGSGTTASGGTVPPPYCATPPVPPASLAAPLQGPSGGLNYPNGGWFACSLVQSKTGATIGSSGGGTYGTGVNGGISYICANYHNPMVNAQAPTWVITLPLINPQAFQNNNGTSAQMDIVAFANFELDCGAYNVQPGGWNLSGGTPSIIGRFVKFTTPEATAGNPNGVDTGVETVILVQ
jgi:putative Flp pilus-assembly TadE/G-like protein